MPRAARKSKTSETVIEAVAERVIQRIQGHRSKGRYRWVEATPEQLEFEEGTEPLRCEIRANPTWAERQEIVAQGTNGENWALIAPYVRAWNVLDAQGKPVPAPMEAGPDVMMHLTEEEFIWLFFRVKLSNVEKPDLPKELTTTDDTPAGSDGTS